MILNMDCLAGMATLPDATFDAIVTDPPYELGFMSRSWDSTGIAYRVDLWREALRVLKPGGHLLAFSGSRTYHRMVVAIEDAGFEIRDQIMWVYGSGFPKSLDVSKAIDKAAGAEREKVRTPIGPTGNKYAKGLGDPRPWMERAAEAGYHEHDSDEPATAAAAAWAGWGTALKPAHEPIAVARKPLVGTVAANVLAHGCGAINIDGCRVATDDKYSYPNGAGGSSFTVGGGIDGARTDTPAMHDAGRWPANLIHDGSDEVVALFPDSNGQLARASTSDTQRAGQNTYGTMTRGSNGQEPRGDAGSAARFFKTCAHDEEVLIFCRAKAVLAAWNPNLANVAENYSFPSSELVASVLSDAVTSASLGGSRLSALTGLSTIETPNELKTLCETLIASMLILGKNASPELRRDAHFPNGSRVQFAETNEANGIIRITISLSKSCGSVENVIFSIMPTNSEAGARGFAQSTGDRFIYCAKASKRDRDEGLTTQRAVSGVGALRDGGRPSEPRANTHPTVKPTALMRYLCRLVTPPGGTVLDPFAGSGSTGKAAVLEGFSFIGFEREAEYAAIAQARIDAVRSK